MIPKDLLKDYLIDQEDGLKNLLTWFLNLVMQFEAMEQIDAEPYQRVDSRKAHSVNAGQKVHRSGGMKVLRSINTCLLLFH